MFQAYFEDKEKGGLFHAVKEDWSEVVDTDKHAEEQFNAARISVIGAMITHDPETIKDAELAVDEVMDRFRDKDNGGYYSIADRDWNITGKEKSLAKTGSIFGILMHLYEVNMKDAYLLKALDFLDVSLEKAWDNKHGGFFSLYTEGWKPATDIKDLATQVNMLQHMNGSWKDGMDSPFGARSAYHKKRAEDFGMLLLEKTRDRVNGGFYTSFKEDWSPAEKEKDVKQLASLVLTFYFHYHNMGPSIWGPRKGSHAYTGRPYPEVYAYRGPAPCPEPVSDKAYLFGKTVKEVADILLDHAWDADHGGFYTSLKENLEPENNTKLISTQIMCLLALNVAYRLTGFPRFQEKLAETVKTVEEKCFDPENSGVYSSFDRSWTPTLTDKICEPNLMAGGILSMVQPVSEGLNVTRQALASWIEPQAREIEKNGSANFTITVQNQGFEKVRVRVGGLTAPGRWMDPGDVNLDLEPHEIRSYPLNITPPKDMPEGTYWFEISCMPAGGVADYVPLMGKIIITG
jgi:mannose/cellobiose epimerase-like protein (N-acyl-D-glucosamine 2-epimerase family)